MGDYRAVRALENFEANNSGHVVAIDGVYRCWKVAGQTLVKD
jgi:hypothetical protein